MSFCGRKGKGPPGGERIAVLMGEENGKEGKKGERRC